MADALLQINQTPTGCLVSPKKDKLIFFIKDPKSRIIFPDVMTELWYCTIEGIPTKLKNTRRIDLESAIETWTELISNGWESIKDQINDDHSDVKQFSIPAKGSKNLKV